MFVYQKYERGRDKIDDWPMTAEPQTRHLIYTHTHIDR